MKVEVLKNFKDKETGKIHKTGETFKCSKKRYAEIMKVDENFIRVLNDEESGEEEQSNGTKINKNTSGSGSLCDIAQAEEHEEGCLAESELESMNYGDLKKLAKNMELSIKGSKEELIKRIAAEKLEISKSGDIV